MGDNPLPDFDAGAHVDLRIGGGPIRQYSLCNDPGIKGRYRLGILLDPNSRGGSIAAHAELIEGAVVEIGMPRNHFPLVSAAKGSLLFGGGIGITPLLAMAYTLAERGAAFDLHYSVRERSRAAFFQELTEGAFSDHVHFHFNDGPAGQLLDMSIALGAEPDGRHVYVCGPAGFIDFITNEARMRGWPASQIHSERFDADVDKSGGSFEFVASSSQRSFIIPSDKTIAEVLLAAGVDVPVSCEQGICGTCLCDVLEGVPDHRDLVQSDEEKSTNAQIALCCSRSLSPKIVVRI
ncbi:PDR/VanB family oxidoreductase [Glacieibacterium megasporae]|uniref:PDR/VanB family oxidoreductase n=1 Tax=Glacieibacterium megasporae TaxID=2835787 RepID=UPI001C1E8210|nr:PDR/VanB family oxidoreductase [Polymorphobacter megasporae]UAJ10519.1 PDR/VanB family oxidoreductase [Polymorphobacter megasporae]